MCVRFRQTATVNTAQLHSQLLRSTSQVQQHDLQCSYKLCVHVLLLLEWVLAVVPVMHCLSLVLVHAVLHSILCRSLMVNFVADMNMSGSIQGDVFRSLPDVQSLVLSDNPVRSFTPP